MAALPGLLAATLAALAELLVVGREDRPLGAVERNLRTLTVAYVGGQAVLGLVLAIISTATAGTAIPGPVPWLGALALVVAALGNGLIWRSRPRSSPTDMTPDDRVSTLLRLALAQAVGILGFAAAVAQRFI
jgi:hypothetical protein